MEEPLTEELLAALLSAPDPKTYIDKNKVTGRTLPEYLQTLLTTHNLKRPDVIREAQLNETYGYQIFMGQRKPTRDKVLALAFAMGLSLTEAGRLAQAAGVNPLYAKNRRDAILIFCLDNGYSLQRANEELYRFGEETLC